MRYLTKQSPFNCSSRVSQSEDQKNFTLQYFQFGRFIEVKLYMSPHLSLVNFSFCVHINRVFAFLYYTAFVLPVIATNFRQSNLFWDCVNGFVNTFSVHNSFNATNNFIRFLNFTYSFVEVNVDVTYDGNRNLSKLMNKSKPGSNGSNKNAILMFLLLASSFFHLLIKEKPVVRFKTIPLAIFFFKDKLKAYH